MAMMVLVAYDVNTEDAQGRRRLRRVAQVCLDYGQRVQNSVFECQVGTKELTLLKGRIQNEMSVGHDSVRIYFLNESDRHRTQHYGTKKPRDLDEPLII
jgi:CRISPR-associated protein Cas2